jgi:hypothetical protein
VLNEMDIHSPIRCNMKLMEILPALLTEVLLRDERLVHKPNTPTMLPDLTTIALNKEGSQILRQSFRLRSR